MIILLFFLVSSDSSYHKINDLCVPYYVKIGPAHFPFEFYDFTLFSEEKESIKYKKSFIDFIIGNDPKDVGIRLPFGKNVRREELGKVSLNTKKIKFAIDKKFLVKFLIDGLSCSCEIGFKDNFNEYNVFSEYAFSIYYKDNKIVDVNVLGEKPLKVDESKTITIHHSCKWMEMNGEKDKNDLENNNFQTQNHKYAIINSLVLTGFITILILFLLNRIFINDDNKYQQLADFDGFDLDKGFENGWKAIHGNVFRPPRYVFLISLLSGTGMHLYLFLMLLSIIVYIKGYSNQFDEILKFAILTFLFTSPFSGFFSVTLGRAFSYKKWIKLSLFSGTIVHLTIAFILICLSLFWKISIYMIICLIIISIISLPLSWLGGLIAMNLKLFEGNKCEVALVPRKIPGHPWYLRKKFTFPIVGFICFISIAVEIYYMFYSIWNYKGFYLYSFISLILLILISSSLTFLMIYIYLQNEDYHWQWKSFCAPSFIGIFIFIYSIYYLKKNIHDLTQNIFYILTMLIYSLTVSILSGGIGYFLTSIFIHKLYNELKLD